MVKTENLSQDNEKTGGSKGPLPPVRQISKQSADELRLLASRSPEKLRKALERLAEMAGEGAKTTSRNK